MFRNVAAVAHNWGVTNLAAENTEQFNKRHELGSVYTPDFLATWLVGEVRKLGFEPQVIVDPAAGEGALLRAGERVFGGLPLLGFDIDPVASTYLAKENLSPSSQPRDALCESWNLDTNRVLVVANPPWGMRVAPPIAAQFALARGQFDSYDLFIEKIVQELPWGSWGAVFVPDSILMQQHVRTRRYLVERTRIRMIARLGEGLFPSVAIGCVALIFSREQPSPKSMVHCVRLTKADRVAASGSSSALGKIVDLRKRSVEMSKLAPEADQGFWELEPQAPLRKPESTRFISSRSADFAAAWSTWFTTSRGIEIGKSGTLLKCAGCGTHYPPSKASASIDRICVKCGAGNDRLSLVSIFARRKAARMLPVVVGEDVRRYRISASRFIPTAIDGLRFKREPISSPRILVRKTGLGIQACATESTLVTTQTVFSFEPKLTTPAYALDYVAGFLSSRVLNALHVARSGHSEWKSHPYVTQSSLKTLPLLIPTRGSVEEGLAIEIADLARTLRLSSDSNGPMAIDMSIDRKVARLLGGGDRLIAWAMDTLSQTTGSAYLRQLASADKEWPEERQ